MTVKRITATSDCGQYEMTSFFEEYQEPSEFWGQLSHTKVLEHAYDEKRHMGKVVKILPSDIEQELEDKIEGMDCE